MSTTEPGVATEPFLDSLGILPVMEDPRSFEFFRRILSSRRNLTLLGRKYQSFDPNEIVSVEYRDPPFKGLVNRNELTRVTFRTESKDTAPLEVLLKTTRHGADEMDISNRHHKQLESMRYQLAQMMFWDDFSLPTPIVFGLARERPQKGFTNYTLMMEFLDGITFDLHILALNQIRGFLDGEEVPKQLTYDKIAASKSAVELEIRSIIKSSLEANTRFHEIKESDIRNHNPSLFSPHDTIKYYLIQRGEHYARRLINYVIQAQPFGTIKFKVTETRAEELVEELTQLLKPFIIPFTDLERLCHAHGDEYLHHFQYNGRNGDRNSVVFDADHTMRTRPEYSHAKILTSFLLDLNIEQEIEYLEGAFKHGRYNPNLFGDFDQVTNDYAFISIALRLFDMGKRASNALIDSATDARIVTGVSYRPHKLRLPSDLANRIPPSVKYPDVPNSLAIQGRHLSERLFWIASNDRFSREYNGHAVNLGRFLETYGLIPLK